MEPLATRRRDAADLISALPDELLHAILVRLQSTAAAGRTSVLSRRWRGVWAHMPELVLAVGPAPATPPSALLDSIDGALDSYAAPALHSLKIDASEIDRRDVPARRVAPWLRFASQRLDGKLCLALTLKDAAQTREEELPLPVCERATEIELQHLKGFVLRPPPTGSFSALTELKLSYAQMDGGELGRLVSSATCPRLRTLCLVVVKLDPVRDVSVRSESLETLEYSARCTRTGKLEVTAPMLQEISVVSAAEASIVAPKLDKVKWTGEYNPRSHHFGVAPRNLQLLSIMHWGFLGILISSTQLMGRYDTAKKLKISLRIHKDIAGYVTFLREMDKLPLCETLVVSLMVNHHALLAVMFHLLRRCSHIRKLELLLDWFSPPKMTPCSISGCPCLLPENYRLDGITFDSLEEIWIGAFTGSDEDEQFMNLLLPKCNTVALKRVHIMVRSATVSSEIMDLVERVRSVCHPNSKVQFDVFASKPPRPLRHL